MRLSEMPAVNLPACAYPLLRHFSNANWILSLWFASACVRVTLVLALVCPPPPPPPFVTQLDIGIAIRLWLRQSGASSGSFCSPLLHHLKQYYEQVYE